MRLEINEKDKLALFWLTGAEQGDMLLQERLRREFAAYRQQKYTVAVFRSGNSDLTDVTEGLLLHNQKVAARQDLKQAQQAAEASPQPMNL